MSQDLAQLAADIRTYAGLTRKQPIAEIFQTLVLDGEPGPQLPNYGDDAAALAFKDGYLLLATDGIMTGLLVNEPYAAGKASVMVTVNDIYSMGGRPMALVNVLASGPAAQRAQVVAGMRKGCAKLGVPMVGGHLHPDAPADQPSLSVAILGWATSLLRSHLAQPGDELILAVDLGGRAGCRSVVSWDANSGKTPAELKERLEVLPAIAEAGLAQACKDVSNAGILGTFAIMMENSGRGAVLDLAAIPCPPSLTLEQWVLCFQSYGFALAVPPAHAARVKEMFQAQGVAAATVGRVTGERLVKLAQAGREEVLFDFQKEQITGISYSA
ncbi:MAG: methanogenesis marker 2 protein [Deltaproteobacteria bacterium]|nr:methanogenesis marker 2 protein [Deltaproteobacteria bacterium]